MAPSRAYMENVEKRTLTEVPLITSLLKEAVFLTAPCTITTKGRVYTSALIEVVETDLRNKDTRTKSIKFRGEPELVVCKDTLLECEIALSSFVVLFKTTVVGTEVGNIVAVFPEEATFFQRRKSGRTIFNGQLFSTVIIETEGLTSESELLLLNTSSNGYGGILKTTLPAEMLVGSKLYGKINLGTYFQDIHAEIAHVTEIKTPNSKHQEYQIGLKNRLESLPGKLNRKNIRLIPKSPDLITLSAEPSGRVFQLDGIDFSISGFSGKLRNTADFFFPLGTLFREHGTTRIFKLVHGEGSTLRLSLHSSSIPDRIQWTTRIIENGAYQSEGNKKDAKELIRLFTEAGAINQHVFQRTSKHWSLFDRNYRNTEIQNRWIFRCLSYRDGRLSGHVSGIRFSDSHWFIGDGAGGYTQSSKMDPTFIPKYFRAFREFALNLAPTPRLLMIWKQGHAFWNGFEAHLRNFAIASIGRFHHSPLPTLSYNKCDARIDLTEIRSSDFEKIKFIRDGLRENGTLAFADAFDFDEFRFGSPAVRTLNEDLTGSTFERKYFELKVGQFHALVIFTFLPQGLSVNQVITSAYVLQIHGAVEQWELCIQKIQQIGISNGMEPSSIRRVTNESEGKLEGETYSSNAFIADVRSLEYFEILLKEAV